jgi:hypothetical protein
MSTRLHQRPISAPSNLERLFTASNSLIIVTSTPIHHKLHSLTILNLPHNVSHHRQCAPSTSIFPYLHLLPSPPPNCPIPTPPLPKPRNRPHQNPRLPHPPSQRQVVDRWLHPNLPPEHPRRPASWGFKYLERTEPKREVLGESNETVTGQSCYAGG